MKGFIHKILLFLLILFVIVSGVFGISFYLSYRNVSNITLDENINTIICGDSRTKTALNDSIIPNSLNIAHSSEHYLYTYNVLRVLLGNNPQVRTVILGFSFHNLASFYDDYIFEQDKSQYMYPRYFTVLDAKAMSLIFSQNFKGVIGEFKSIYQSVHRHISAKELDRYSFIGEFYDSDRNNKTDSTVNKAVHDHYYNEDLSLQGFSELQLACLEMITDLCHSADVNLILINCPVSREYKAQIPPQFIDYYYEKAEKHHLPLYDFHDFIVAEGYYGDGDHLNKSGSEIFSVHTLDEMEGLFNNAND